MIPRYATAVANCFAFLRSAPRVGFTGVLFLAVAPLFARETAAPVDNTRPATVHQWGIVRSGAHLDNSDLLPLPDFVHRSPTTSADPSASPSAWLAFSALHIIPPQMTTQHLTLNITQGTTGTGKVTAWYPYAAGTSAAHERTWSGVHAGVIAEPLETTHPVWMPGRGMEAAATLKVYRPGPAGSKPDDPGTTEGDVYIFMRANAGVPAPLIFTTATETTEWEISPPGDTHVTATENTAFAWLAEAKSDEHILSRRIRLAAAHEELLVTRTHGTVEFETYTSDPLALRIQLNEALVGNGLRGDEASAQTRLVVQAIQQHRKPVLIYLLPPAWIDEHFPLSIDGPAEKPVRVYIGIAELSE